MTFRVSPLWWPVLAVTSPVLLPILYGKSLRFKKNRSLAKAINHKRIAQAHGLDLPELTRFAITVVVERKTASGFVGSPAVSYLLETEEGRVLFDLGFGSEDDAVAANSRALGLSNRKLEGVVISHLHPDHMGGFRAVKKNTVTLKQGASSQSGLPLYLPEWAAAATGVVEVVNQPRHLVAGLGTTGPLARSLFLMGWVEEQAVVARVKGKGVVVLTGCGHPTIEVIVQMVQKLCNDPIYAIIGGLHFPVTDSPLKKAGCKAQMIWGTGKPPWQRITDQDLTATIAFINTLAPEKILLSGHDCCDHALARFCEELHCDTRVLKAGCSYEL